MVGKRVQIFGYKTKFEDLMKSMVTIVDNTTVLL